MSNLVVDSGIHTRRDLVGILPADLAPRIDEELLRDSSIAAALRVLATIKDPTWQQYVQPWWIDWAALLNYGRQMRRSNSRRVRIEVAASLADQESAQVSLLYVAASLDRENFLAVIDALRIARLGLEP